MYVLYTVQPHRASDDGRSVCMYVCMNVCMYSAHEYSSTSAQY